MISNKFRLFMEMNKSKIIVAAARLEDVATPS